ncbi:retinitis pigmentosa GTPase regulator b [Xenentodon cancila]
MAGEAEDEIPESGAVFTFGKSKFADNIPSKFWLKNDVPWKIACGDEHTALITENGKLFMFGSNNWGQLGLGSKLTVNKPTCVKALKSEKVQLVACGRNHTLVCTAQGRVYACGGNSEGQLGLGHCEEKTSFHRVDFFDAHGPIRMLAAGSNTSAALTASGKLFMWGDNAEGQIGLGKESQASSPQELSVRRPVSWVSCGYYHSALVTVDGALYTFGERDSGKLGLSTEQLSRHRVPQRVKSITEPVRQVACGGGHTVALTDNHVFTFGLGQFGQLGHGTFIFESRLPRSVDHFRRGRVCQVSCGENHTAIITDGGLLYTFGDGRHGKLGLGEENFTNQFKPTLCPRFLSYHVQAVMCGGCHMVVMARPRGPGCADVTLEEDDVTEDFLEKPLVELLGDSSSCSTLQRSLSARVRRRERERSPDQFGAMFCTLPTRTSGFLQPRIPIPNQTVPARPTEATPRKVLNGTRQPGCAGSSHREQTGFQADSAEDGLTDTDSVPGLGETTDFLNMTHVMKMDPSDQTSALSPLQKRKAVHAKPQKVQSQRKERKLSKQGSFSSSVSPRRALPTELLRSVLRSQRANGGQNKENLLMEVERLDGRPVKCKTPVDIRKVVSQSRPKPVQGKSQLMQVSRKPAVDQKQSPDTRKTVSSVSSDSAVAEVRQVRVKSKPAVAQRQPAAEPGKSSSSEEQSCQTPPDGNRSCRSKHNLTKTSKNEKNRKNQIKEATKDPNVSGLSLLAGAATLAAGAGLILGTEASGHSSSASPSQSSARKQRSDESESRNKSTVSINIIPADQSTDQRTSLDEDEEQTDSAAAGEEEDDQEEEEEDGDKPDQRTKERGSEEEEEEEEESTAEGEEEGESSEEEESEEGTEKDEEEKEETEGSEEEDESQGDEEEEEEGDEEEGSENEEEDGEDDEEEEEEEDKEGSQEEEESEEDDENEEDDEIEDEDDAVETGKDDAEDKAEDDTEEEENDSSASSSERPVEEVQSPPGELKDPFEPDGAQKAADISEDKRAEDTEAANGEADGSCSSQSGSSRKVEADERFATSRPHGPRQLGWTCPGPAPGFPDSAAVWAPAAQLWCLQPAVTMNLRYRQVASRRSRERLDSPPLLPGVVGW